jgi:hypothetical protein
MRTAARIQARTMGRATAALFAFVGLVLAAETPALASPPTRVPERTVTYSLSADCGSFNVEYRGTSSSEPPSSTIRRETT